MNDTVYTYTPHVNTSGIMVIPLEAWPTQHQFFATFQEGATFLVKTDKDQSCRIVISQKIAISKKDAIQTWSKTLSLVRNNPTNLGALLTQPGCYLGELQKYESSTNSWIAVCGVQIEVQPSIDAITQSVLAVGRGATTAIIAAIAPPAPTPDVRWWNRIPAHVLWFGVGFLGCFLLAVGDTVWYLIDEQGNGADAEPIATQTPQEEEEPEGDTGIALANEPEGDAGGEADTMEFTEGDTATTEADTAKEEAEECLPFATTIMGRNTQMVGGPLLTRPTPAPAWHADGATWQGWLLNGELVCRRVANDTATVRNVMTVTVCPENVRTAQCVPIHAP